MAPMAPEHPKPLVGLFLHMVWPKNEEDILLKNFLFKLVVSGSPIRTCD
jgi:hypothetical protein